MEDLINELQEKAGLTPEQSAKALEVIKAYIQGQLPPMMQGMVENFMSGGGKKNSDNAIGE